MLIRGFESILKALASIQKKKMGEKKEKWLCLSESGLRKMGRPSRISG